MSIINLIITDMLLSSIALGIFMFLYFRKMPNKIQTEKTVSSNNEKKYKDMQYVN